MCPNNHLPDYNKIPESQPMTSITNRYASAIHSSNLKSEARTANSDSDVLGAMGIADRRLTKGINEHGDKVGSEHPMAVPLERLFVGDRASAGVIIQLLAGNIRGKAQSLRIRMSETQATDMAKAVLGWFRAPACRVCGGHGFKVIKNTTTLGDSKCRPCNGSGKVLLEELFHENQRELVRWAAAQMEREAGQAGPAAMRALAPSLEL
jgi:hypothetical protein